MGTRSLVHFHDDLWDEKEAEIIVTIYRQMDGYYDGRGEQLATWLATKTMTNGIAVGTDVSATANGMGCLAAQWIAEEKNGVGGIYIQKPGVAEKDDIFIEYEYHVRVIDNELELEARGHDGYDLPFKGKPADFDAAKLKVPERKEG